MFSLERSIGRLSQISTYSDIYTDIYLQWYLHSSGSGGGFGSHVLPNPVSALYPHLTSPHFSLHNAAFLGVAAHSAIDQRSIAASTIYLAAAAHLSHWLAAPQIISFCPFHRNLYSAWFYVELFNVIYCAHNKIIFTPLGWFPISDQRKPRATSNFTFNIYIQILTRKVRICQGFVLVAVVRSPL